MKLLVSPLEAVEALCKAHDPSHLVSWLSPPAIPPEIADAFPPERRLFLSSHDVVAPVEGLRAPTTDDVARLVAFARSWAGTGAGLGDGARPMLVHCWAGVSRSTAAAFVIACALSPRRESELAWAMRAASPGATPNPLIVAHADVLLGREGRMIAAIADIGRGAEVSLGAPFEFQLS